MAKKNQNTFEEKLERLDTIVQLLDSGELSIEEMMKIYEEGMNLAQECRSYLEKAEQKIEIIEKSHIQ